MSFNSPKLYFSEIPNSIKSATPRVIDRYDLIESRKLTDDSLNEKNPRLKRTNNRLKKHFSEIEQLMIQRNQAGLDSEWWLEKIKDIRQLPVPIQQNIFPLIDEFPQPIVLGKTSKVVERKISINVTSYKDNAPSLNFFHDDDSLYSVDMVDFSREFLSINQNIWKLTVNFKFQLNTEEIQYPGKESFFSMAINAGGFNNFIQIPISIESTRPELELIIKKDSQDGVKNPDTLNLRPLVGGEKFYLSAMNNSSKAKQAVIKLTLKNNPQIIAETVLQLLPDTETPVLLNFQKKQEKDSGDVLEYGADEELVFDIYDQTEPGKSKQRRIITTLLKDPREFVSVDSTMYVPA
ncbi:MAG: hypothetical protein ACK47R_23090, partial [Planctomycetia bacterium]